MATDAHPRSTARCIDDAALARLVRRMSSAPRAPWLHEEVARRMGQRLELIKLRPARIVDWWPRAGGGEAVLLRAYPGVPSDAVEPGAPSTTDAAQARRWWSPRRWMGMAPRALAADDVTDASAQLVWANMMLHTAPDPMAVMRRWHRALAVDGFLMFSTFGPGSLHQLRSLYESQRWGPPMAPLVDMHDLGDMLVEAGFADPVMDQELITLSWSDAATALAELREMGANADPARSPGLRTPRWRARLIEGLTRYASGTGERVELGFEVVYGHAFKPPPRVRVAPESAVALEDLRSMARSRRGGQGIREP